MLLSVCNGAPYIAEAIESILAQTLGDFELLVMDDGSTDGTAQIIADIAQRDSRIRILKHPSPAGLPASLNELAANARGVYLARMDADDRAHPERLARQVAFLDSNPGVLVVSCWFREFGLRSRTKRPVHRHEDIRFTLLFDSPICHPGVVMRASVFSELGLAYPPLPMAQDYGLWAAILRHGALRCLPEVLLDYRVHTVSMTATGREQRNADLMKVYREVLPWFLGTTLTEEDLSLHCDFVTRRSLPLRRYPDLVAWLWRLWCRTPSIGSARIIARLVAGRMLGSFREWTGRLVRR